MALPDSVRTLFAIATGPEWPALDEDAIRLVAGAWRAFEADLRLAHNNLADVGPAIKDGWQGQAAETCSETVYGASRDLDALAQTTESVAGMLRELATEVQYTKWSIIGQLAILALLIATAVAALWIPGAVQYLMPYIDGLIQLGNAFARRMVAELVVNLLENVVMSESVDVILQGAQRSMGTRDHWDSSLTAQAGVSAVIGGVADASLGLIAKIGRSVGEAIGAKQLLAVLDVPMVSLSLEVARGAASAEVSLQIVNQIYGSVPTRKDDGYGAAAGALGGIVGWFGGRRAGARLDGTGFGPIEVPVLEEPMVTPLIEIKQASFTGEISMTGFFPASGEFVGSITGRGSLRTTDGPTFEGRITAYGRVVDANFVGQSRLVARPATTSEFGGRAAYVGDFTGRGRFSGDFELSRATLDGQRFHHSAAPSAASPPHARQRIGGTADIAERPASDPVSAALAAQPGSRYGASEIADILAGQPRQISTPTPAGSDPAAASRVGPSPTHRLEPLDFAANGSAQDWAHELSRHLDDAASTAATHRAVAIVEAAPPVRPSAEDGRTATAGYPWYLDHGATGDSRLRGLAEWNPQQAADNAHQFADLLPRGILADRVHAALSEMLADNNVETWRGLLQRGRTIVVDNRLVWLKPELYRPRELPAEPAPTVRQYGAQFSSTSAGRTSATSNAISMDMVGFAAFNLASAAASAAVLGLPQIGVGVGRRAQQQSSDTVVTGRRLFVSDTRRFAAGIKIGLFINGEPRPVPSNPGIARDLLIELPAVYVGHREPRPDLSVGVSQPGPGMRQPVRSRVGLNAASLAPVVAGLQRSLLDGGIGAKHVSTITDQLHELLDEDAALSRGRWWATTGDTSNRLHVKLSAMRSFDGYITIKTSIDSVQFLGVTPGVQIRDDLGRMTVSTSTRSGQSSASIGIAATLIGQFGSAGPNPDGPFRWVAPMAGVQLGARRSTGLSLGSQAGGHTVLNQTDEAGRYRVRLAVRIDVHSTTHQIRPVVQVIDAELGMPWRNGQEARSFEHDLFGVVRTPAVRGSQLKTPDPLAAHPHLRVQARTLGAAPTLITLRPPSTERPLEAPHPHESLALATRRGLGMAATAVSLPGSGAVHDQLRRVLETLVGSATRERADWSNVDRQLGVYFGTPALEAQLDDLMAGITHTVTVAGADYRLSAKAILRGRVDGSTCAMSVDTRALTANVVDSQRGTGWQLSASAGGSARIDLGNIVRIQPAGVRLQSGYGRSVTETFSSTARSYRRTATEGMVQEHVYRVIYELSVTPLRSGHRHHGQQWWVDESGNLARLAVPMQHVPSTALSSAELALAGQRSYLGRWPQATANLALDTAGSTGLYPAFFVLPELAALAWSLHAGLTPPPKAEIGEPTSWPALIRALARPSALAARFGEMTGSQGWQFALPAHAGWDRSLRIRMRAYAPRELDRRSDIEIEHYVQSALSVGTDRETGWGLGLKANAYLQLRTHGTDSTQDNAGAGGSGNGQHVGRFLAEAEVGAGYSRTHKLGTDEGNIEITRASYTGAIRVLRTDPVFEVTATRANGTRSESITRYLKISQALDLLIPERRAEDVLGARPRAAALEAGAVPRLVRDYVDPRLPLGAVHPEAVSADEVLPAIIQRLVSRRLIAVNGKDGPDRALVLRSLAESFSSVALESQFPALQAEGAWLWLPINRNGGSTSYLWVNVSIAKLDAAHGHRARSDVTLTFRSQSLEQRSDVTAQERSIVAGVLLRGRGGNDGSGDETTAEPPAQVASDHADQQPHGGGGIGASATYGISRAHAEGVDTKSMDIYRMTPRETAQEFSHRVLFRIELGGTTEPPEIVRLSVAAIRPGVVGLARLVGRSREFTKFWNDHRPWTWRDDGSHHLIPGGVRLLTPTHMTMAVDPHRNPTPTGAIIGAVGENPRWGSATSAAVRPTPALVAELQPVTVGAASSIQRWAQFVALDSARPQSLGATDASRPPPLDASSPDALGYRHYTSHGMLRANLPKLLQHTYEVPVASMTVTVGLELHTASVIGPETGEQFKGRRYARRVEKPKSELEGSREGRVGLGFEAGGEGAQGRLIERLLPELWSRTETEQQVSAIGTTLETNLEGIRAYRRYGFEVVVVLRRKGVGWPELRVTVPGGLIALLPLDPDGRLDGEGIEEFLSGLPGHRIVGR